MCCEYSFSILIPSIACRWKAKKEVLAKMFGNWDDAFRKLPILLATLQHVSSMSAIVELKTLPAYDSN